MTIKEQSIWILTSGLCLCSYSLWNLIQLKGSTNEFFNGSSNKANRMQISLNMSNKKILNHLQIKKKLGSFSHNANWTECKQYKHITFLTWFEAILIYQKKNFCLVNPLSRIFIIYLRAQSLCSLNFILIFDNVSTCLKSSKIHL